MAADVGDLLTAKGLLVDRHPNPGNFAEAEAAALWK
jgi:hypothetical protein